jgi:hypothetical protein
MAGRAGYLVNPDQRHLHRRDLQRLVSLSHQRWRILEVSQNVTFVSIILTTRSHWQWPTISGLHSFQGTLLHSAAWSPSTDLRDQRVAVIGNGSSGIQLVTALQPGESICRGVPNLRVADNGSCETLDDVHPKSDLDLNHPGPRIRWTEWSKFRM